MQDPAITLSEITPETTVFLQFFAGIFFAGILIDILLIIQWIKNPPDWNSLREKIKFNPWSWQDGILILAFYAGLSAIVSLAVRAIPQTLIETPAFLLFQIVLLPVTGFFVVAFLVRRKSTSATKAFGMEPGTLLINIMRGIAAYMATLPPLLMISFFYLIMLSKFNWPLTRQPAIEWIMDASHPLWIHASLFVTAALFAPIVEEILFRGIALPILLKDARISLSVFFVSLLFAMIHNHVPTLVPIFILATGLSAGYILTGSLVVPVTMHIIFNTVNLAALLLTRGTVL